jgi:K+-transporting ATPase KdpF subunit
MKATLKEAFDGLRIPGAVRRVLAARGRHGQGLRQPGRAQAMSGLYVLGSVVSIGLLVYLVAALLRPEDFS